MPLAEEIYKVLDSVGLADELKKKEVYCQEIFWSGLSEVLNDYVETEYDVNFGRVSL